MNEYDTVWSGLKTDFSLLGDRLSGQHPLSDASSSLRIEQGGLKKRREAAQKRQARWRARHPGVEAAAKKKMRAERKETT